MVTVKVKLEDSIVKRSVHGPELLVTQFVLRSGCVAKRIKSVGMRLVSLRAFK